MHKHPFWQIAIFSVIISLPLFSSLLPSQTYAAPVAEDVCEANIDQSFRDAFGCEYPDQEEKLPEVILAILQNVIIVSGTVAAIFMIIGGINYMTSRGDQGKLEKARNTLLYAAIGLVVCSLAFITVNWVISSVLKQNKGSDSSSQEASEESNTEDSQESTVDEE